MGSSSSKQPVAAPAPAPAAPAIDPGILAQIQSLASNQKSQAEQILQGLAPKPEPVAALPVAPKKTRWWLWALMFLVVAVLPIAGIGIWSLVTGNKIELFNDYPGTLRSVPASGQKLPRSMNAPSGLEFSYGFWLVVSDWSYRYGERKHVFTKGDMSKGQQCPAVFLSATENAIEVMLDVFPNKHEMIKIDNLPGKKWIHFAIVVRDEKTIEVYVNGRLRDSRRASGIIKQNDGSVTVADSGGFNGYMTRFEYYDHAMAENEVSQLASDVPKLQPNPQFATPPYFANVWYTQ